MRIDIMTLFPDSVDAMLNVSILGRAQQRGYISIQSHQIRRSGNCLLCRQLRILPIQKM